MSPPVRRTADRAGWARDRPQSHEGPIGVETATRGGSRRLWVLWRLVAVVRSVMETMVEAMGSPVMSSCVPVADAVRPPIESSVDAVPTPVKAILDAVAPAIEPVGPGVVAVGPGSIRAPVKAVIDAFASVIEAVIDAIAAVLPVLARTAGARGF